MVTTLMNAVGRKDQVEAMERITTTLLNVASNILSAAEMFRNQPNIDISGKIFFVLQKHCHSLIF